MKASFALFAVAVFLAAGTPLRAQTLNWGSAVFSQIVDSTGQTLDNTFVFEIGAFTEGFVPEESNVDSWLANWKVFDQAAYNQSIGYFSSTVHMLDDGTSDSPEMSAGAPSFEGLSAYLWIRKGDDPVEGSEWLLTRADNWTFPTATPGCCDKELPVQWSVSDLDGGDVPEWGKQGDVSGSGVSTSTGGPYTLQTFTFVPEPGTAMMSALGIGCLCLRRRRI
jgi:hypothetical protein